MGTVDGVAALECNDINTCKEGERWRSRESGLETERGRKRQSQRERLYDDRRWNVEEEKEMIGLQQRIIKSTLVN